MIPFDDVPIDYTPSPVIGVGLIAKKPCVTVVPPEAVPL